METDGNSAADLTYIGSLLTAPMCPRSVSHRSGIDRKGRVDWIKGKICGEMCNV